MNGNILNKSDVGAYTYAGTGYANPHAPTTINGVNYTYDNAGNMTSAGTAAYTWNYRNRLTDTNVNSTTTHYLYDEADQRVQQDLKIGAGATTTTKYFNQYYETTGATTTLYVYALGQLLATIEGNGVSTTTVINHTDHQGSTNVTSNSTGGLAQLNSYYPFGALRLNQNSSNLDQKKKALGQYYDSATDLNYYNARYMSGARGQFMSEDPVLQGPPSDRFLADPQQLNTYSYAANNPVVRSDPDGQFFFIPLIIAAAAAIISYFSTPAIVQAPVTNTAVNSAYYQSAQAQVSAINTAGTAAITAMGAPAIAKAGVSVVTAGVKAVTQAVTKTTATQATTRATQINGALDPVAQNMRTTSVLQTDAQTVVASGGRDLAPVQRNMLSSGEVPAANMPGAHAEVTAITHAQNMGWNPQSMGVSRPICTTCQEFIRKSGGQLIGDDAVSW